MSIRTVVLFARSFEIGVEKDLLTSFEMIGSVIPSRCEESFSWHFDYLQVIVTSRITSWSIGITGPAAAN